MRLWSIIPVIAVVFGLVSCGSQFEPTDAANSGEVWPAPDDFVRLDMYPEMIYQESPEYPRLARQAGIEGTVVIKALVDEEGKVLKALEYKSSGTPSLDEAAVEAASKCQYKPGIQNGRPVKVWVTYKVEFKLDDEQ